MPIHSRFGQIQTVLDVSRRGASDSSQVIQNRTLRGVLGNRTTRTARDCLCGRLEISLWRGLRFHCDFLVDFPHEQESNALGQHLADPLNAFRSGELASCVHSIPGIPDSNFWAEPASCARAIGCRLLHPERLHSIPILAVSAVSLSGGRAIPELEISLSQSMSQIATGRRLLVAAAGEPWVHPSVRWGAAPGRRSPASTTRWAFHNGTARIGAGAGRQGVRTHNAATPVVNAHADDASKNPERKKLLR